MHIYHVIVYDLPAACVHCMNNVIFPPHHVIAGGPRVCVPHTQRKTPLAVYRMDSAIMTRTYGSPSLVVSVYVTPEVSFAMTLSARS